MPQLLSLLRAARLVGVSRGTLQRKIRCGELRTFEGMIAAEDLLHAYPEAKLEDHAVLERLEEIKDDAFTRRVRERLLPNSEVLMARLTDMSRERARNQAQLDHYRTLIGEFQDKLRELSSAPVSQASAVRLLAWLARALETGPQGKASQALLAHDSFLRIMTAHVRVMPGGREFFLDGNDTLLEAALRAGLSLDYGCSAGSCGKCKARILSGDVHRIRHSDYVLTAAEKGSGTVLMCCNTAVGDLVIEAHEAHGAADMPLQRIEARVKSVTPMGEGMRLLNLQTPRTNRLRFLAGQAVSLELPGGAAASLPVASCPCDDRNLQFHIPRDPGNAFTECVFDSLKGADTVRIEGPRGEFVLNEESQRPLIFVACETGFAPVKSLIEHAMALDSAESMHLYWIAPDGGHYLDNLCRSWSDALDDFRYRPLKTSGAAHSEEMVERLLQELKKDHPRLGDCDVYLAGSEAFTTAMEYHLLEGGLPRGQLFVGGMGN